MHEERLWELVSLKLSGEISPDELLEFYDLLKRYPDLSLKIEMLQHIWIVKNPEINGARENSFQKHLQRLSNHYSKGALKYDFQGTAATVNNTPEIPKRKNFILIKSIIGIAASFIIFSVFYLKNQEAKWQAPNKTLAYNTISTKPGSKSKVQLPDGTQVWLNADSKITYNENFAGAQREVQLTGEAYFDVVKDKVHPFIIHTTSMDLKVLGTAFNVRSYSNEDKTETSLIHGSIEITLINSPDKKIILRPNEKLVIQNKNTPSQHEKGITEGTEEELPIMVLSKVHFQKKDSIATETMWVKNKLAFDNERLESVALKIERWYGVKVIISDEKLKANEYSGVFEDETIQQVMEALRLTGNFRYYINKKEIIIRP